MGSMTIIFNGALQCNIQWILMIFSSFNIEKILGVGFELMWRTSTCKSLANMDQNWCRRLECLPLNFAYHEISELEECKEQASYYQSMTRRACRGLRFVSMELQESTWAYKRMDEINRCSPMFSLELPAFWHAAMSLVVTRNTRVWSVTYDTNLHQRVRKHEHLWILCYHMLHKTKCMS